MSELENLFLKEVETEPTFHQQMMKEYRTEIEQMSRSELEALRMAELDTLGDTEARVHLLNHLIESKSSVKVIA